MEQEYKGNNCKRHFNPPHRLSNPYELTILSNATENRLGLRYTTHLINFPCHKNGFDAVCKSTVNLAFLRLQHKIRIIQKIKRGNNNEGKCKE